MILNSIYINIVIDIYSCKIIFVSKSKEKKEKLDLLIDPFSSRLGSK